MVPRSNFGKIAQPMERIDDGLRNRDSARAVSRFPGWPKIHLNFNHMARDVIQSVAPFAIVSRTHRLAIIPAAG